MKPTEAVVHTCSLKKVFLEISQNSHENTCAGLWPATLFKKRLCHRCFPVNFAKFLKTRFLTEHVWWLLPNLITEIVYLLLMVFKSSEAYSETGQTSKMEYFDWFKTVKYFFKKILDV